MAFSLIAATALLGFLCIWSRHKISCHAVKALERLERQCRHALGAVDDAVANARRLVEDVLIRCPSNFACLLREV